VVVCFNSNIDNIVYKLLLQVINAAFTYLYFFSFVSLCKLQSLRNCLVVKTSDW